jgi:hypothetical protein
LVWSAWIIACADPATAPGVVDGDSVAVAPALVLSDTTLPIGVLGERYDAVLPLSGGVPPYTLRVDGGHMPEGLALVDASIAGTPSESGDFSVTIRAEDSIGQAKIAQITVPIAWDPTDLPCGATASHEFTSSGYGGDEGVDWSDFGGYTWLWVPWPSEPTTRIELDFSGGGGLTVWIPDPAVPLTSHELLDHYSPFNVDMVPRTPVVVDLGTDPPLAPFVDQGGIPVLVVGGPGTWTVEATCTDGPIFDWLWSLPVRLFDPVEIDFDIIGENDGVRIWTDNPIPEWYVWDEETGRITGTAEEPGGWEIDIHAEDALGRTRTERAILSVYDVTDLHCGEELPLAVTEGMYDGEFTGPYDAKGFDVFRLTFDEGVSAVDLLAYGSNDTHLGVARPFPDFPFYADALYVYTFYGSALLELSPTSYPTWTNFSEPGEAFVIAAPIYGASAMTLTATCDRGPRPDLVGLPVLLPEVAGDALIGATGGTAPWTFSASGLPLGVTLDAGGALRWPPVAAGESDVTVTASDADGGEGSVTLPLWVGDDRACAPDTLVACGDVITGAFLEPYWQANDGPESTLVVCTVPRGNRGIWFEVSTSEEGELYVQLGDPAATASDMLQGDRTAMTAYVEPDLPSQVFADDFAWPWMADYEALPTRVALRALEAGNWTLSVECF